MADDKIEPREPSWRQAFSWTELFRGFQVALDLNKLLLAAAGILTMAFGWWLLAVIFSANEDRTPPDWPGKYGEEGWAEFRRDRDHWNLMHRAADLGHGREPKWEVKDLAETPREYELFQDFKPTTNNPAQEFIDFVAALQKPGKVTDEEAKKFGLTPEARRRLDRLEKVTDEEAAKYRAKAPQYARVGKDKPAGELVVGPWFEDRGPNPYLLVTGQAGIPWEPGHFWEWFTRDQLLVMIEPLVKFVRPLVYFFSPRGNTFWSRLYFLSVMFWTLLTWSVFGGAITRIAAVQVARGEKIGLGESLRYTLRRLLSYLLAPLFPFVFVFVLLVFMILVGLVGLIPYVGDIFVYGLFWPLLLVFGLVMAVALVGLVSWPLMSSTVSADGSDSWEAVSRAYSYVFQRPWSYLWYAVVAVAYGAAVVFFVGFMGSLTVYLAKWGVARTAVTLRAESREPSYLFVYAPTSFGWRELLLEGARDSSGASVVEDRAFRPAVTGPGAGGVNRWDRINGAAYDDYVKHLNAGQWLGACMVAFWLGLFFLLILGFGYSYFWSASTIVYLLMRRKVDTAELDEVYLEEEEPEGPWGAPGTAPAPAPEGRTPAQSLPLVEGSSPRPAVTPSAITAPPAVTPPVATPASPAVEPPPPAPAPAPESPGANDLRDVGPTEPAPPPPAPTGDGNPPTAP